MTVEDMSVEVWEQLGEPSDLVPGTFSAAGSLTYDVTSTGGAKLLNWINTGTARILSYKTKQGRISRFRDLDERVFFQGFEETGTATAGSASTITLASGSSTTDDHYNGMVIELTDGTGDGQSRLITDYNGSTLVATVADDFDTTPDATSVYAINKAFYKFRVSTDSDVADNILVDAKDKILTVTMLKDLEGETELSYRTKGETFVGSSDEVGIPSQWWVEGNGIRFNVAPEDDRWYEAHIRVLPEDVTAGDDTVQVPETFHVAIVMWCVWWGLLRTGNYTAAYAMKRNLDDHMEMTVHEIDFKMEEMDGGVEFYGYGPGVY